MKACRRPLAILLIGLCSACGGVVWDTTVAETPQVRRAMLESIQIGVTTDTQFVTRWGPPLQKVREGGRTEFIYRRQRDSQNFVIVTFDYGIAIGGRSTEFELCRATFAPRIPGYNFDQPSVAVPIGTCFNGTFIEVPLDTFDDGGGTGKGDDLPVRG